ncbi:acyl-ACP--UDP-N-acetylglucosamine O-acyltransferase [Blastochloris viridis]|uniref:Acyl-[acyl-carrier-protein]--UDP-N-acetylglucosamine O-acyltransferase n=1 Tax=Blastochloris viridis TaxID=1079 RepID=A0A0H5BCE9_BLAVI|nr:acyl-ACP--UDP-N-acetylglucosamine O-acyltransferase [Blastochloris viridis]ALK10193.1 Acyl-[acyl-carrier-protein]--UDP-N-acetylglucosamine O-acyltransferase [Blastochloris viridis]BAR99875.1 acyl-[acyl-carrier-protein]--UDP-N-acetylglucosamine O-acyltransferase [Blastochloris viridis]CUU42857.1 Acyl-[acyl-carrier-protein]--UDP-N-acetylglucosamine O-acyltransferase [Blastochloris viridis]
MARIDPTSRVDDGAKLGADVVVGPFCIVGPEVELGDGVELISHAVVIGASRIGARTKIHPFAVIGGLPQAVRHGGGDSRVEVGADCIIRETVTINAGTDFGGGVTTVGDRCFMMAGSHAAHDCHVGDDVIFANNATLGGHCMVGDKSFLGGQCGVHQFVRIGEQSIIGGMTGVEHDVIPFGSVVGSRGQLGGLNLVGLKRRGFSREAIHALRHAYRMLFFGAGTLAERVEQVAAAFEGDGNVGKIVDFLRAGTKRRITMPRELDEV